MRRLALLLTVAFMMTGLGNGRFAQSGEKNGPRVFDGPFVSDALAFYIVHPGGPLEVRFRVETDDLSLGLWQARMPVSLVYRFFDAGEKLLEWQYHRFESPEGPTPDDQEVSAWEHVTALDEAPPGVYQVRYASSRNATNRVFLETDPRSPFGVMPMRSRLYAGAPGQFDEAWVYIPPGADDYVPSRPLRARGEPGEFIAYVFGASGEIYSEDGEKLAEFGHGRRSDTARVMVGDTGVLWRMSLSIPPFFPSRSHRYFGQAGSFNAILCPDPETARAIAGSVTVTPDGQVFPHRFQARMWEWMHALEPEDLAVPSHDPGDEPWLDHWLGEPRNAWLLGPWGAFSRIPWLLAEQTPDNPPPDGRSDAGALAAVFALDKPFNPYFGNEQLANRLLLAEFGRLIDLRETDAFHDTWDPHSGADSFHGNRFAFGYAGRKLAGHEMYPLWLDGVRRIVDRFPHSRMGVENQSLHWLLNIHHVYRGSGLEGYGEISRDYARFLCDPEWNPPLDTGYLMEAYGPDATYQGLAACLLGWYVKETGDQAALQALERIYRLFNHTVAPEPDGRIYGVSNFSCRTEGSWRERQYGGGTLIWADQLPGAAAWHQGHDPQAPTSWSIAEELDRYWDGEPVQPIRSFSDYRFVTRYLHYPERILPAELPVMADERFDRAFGREFYAVRRPGYYALVYTGRPFQRGAAEAAPDQRIRRTGGGLSLFWTPEFGNVITSTNWHVRTNQMLRADLPDGKVAWADCRNLEHEYNEDENRLVSTHPFLRLPADVARDTVFYEDSVAQEVSVTFRDEAEINRLVEQFPFRVLDKLSGPEEDGPLNVFVRLNGEWRRLDGRQKADAVRFESNDGATVEIIFDGKYPVTAGPETTGERQVRGQVLGLLEVELAGEERVAAGHELAFRYRLMPRAAGR